MKYVLCAALAASFLAMAGCAHDDRPAASPVVVNDDGTKGYRASDLPASGYGPNSTTAPNFGGADSPDTLTRKPDVTGFPNADGLAPSSPPNQSPGEGAGSNRAPAPHTSP